MHMIFPAVENKGFLAYECNCFATWSAKIFLAKLLKQMPSYKTPTLAQSNNNKNDAQSQCNECHYDISLHDAISFTIYQYGARIITTVNFMLRKINVLQKRKGAQLRYRAVNVHWWCYMLDRLAYFSDKCFLHVQPRTYVVYNFKTIIQGQFNWWNIVSENTGTASLAAWLFIVTPVSYKCNVHCTDQPLTQKCAYFHTCTYTHINVHAWMHTHTPDSAPHWHSLWAPHPSTGSAVCHWTQVCEGPLIMCFSTELVEVTCNVATIH